MSGKKRILVAPLDWGLGHATRCIPIIKEIMSLGHEAIIATDGRAYDLLKSEIPELQLIRLKGYNPRYPKNGSMILKMGWQVPKFLFAIAWEHIALKKIIRDFSIDAVISDNRYGLWTGRVKSILITHQIFIKMPSWMRAMEVPVNWLNHFFIQRFHHCWVPDENGEHNLSGELSHGEIPSNVEYIGLLSRFNFDNVEEEILEHHDYDVLALLSGPEPQRTILEKEIISQCISSNFRTLIVRGIPEEKKHKTLNELIEITSHLNSKELQETISRSKTVVCRAGYTSLMDLIALRKKAIIIPTPGQTEQEYLAERCGKHNYFLPQQQSQIDIRKGMLHAQKTKLPSFARSMFKEQLAALLNTD